MQLCIVWTWEKLGKTYSLVWLDVIWDSKKKKKKRQPNICGTSLPADQKEDHDVPNGNHIQSWSFAK